MLVTLIFTKYFYRNNFIFKKLILHLKFDNWARLIHFTHTKHLKLKNISLAVLKPSLSLSSNSATSIHILLAHRLSWKQYLKDISLKITWNVLYQRFWFDFLDLRAIVHNKNNYVLTFNVEFFVCVVEN